MLESLNRIMCLKISSAYRTVSTEAADVINGTLPIELLEVRENLLARWKTQWRNFTKGRWTQSLILELKPWLEKIRRDRLFYYTGASECTSNMG